MKDYGRQILNSVDFSNNIMTGDVVVEGVTAEFEMEFDNDSMLGIVNYGGQALPLSAERE